MRPRRLRDNPAPMARFEKTRVHVATATLGLLGLYAIGGLVYSAWSGSPEALMVWAAIAILAFAAAVVLQRFVERKRRVS